MFDDSLLDEPRALAAVDSVLHELATWGAEVRRAALAAEPGLADVDRLAGQHRAVVAAGADGRLLRAVLEPVCPVPFVAWPHAGLPGWTGPLDLVVVHSTTGSEPEVLAVAAEAIRRGAELLVAAPERSPLAEAVAGRGVVLPAGSDDPLALAVPVLEALHRLGLGPQVPAEQVAAALDEVALSCGPTRPTDDNPAKQLALVLAEATPLVWGGSVLAARAARRVSEQLRAASGRPALAGIDAQLVPLLLAAPVADLFADPFADPDEGTADVPRVARPALVVLEDGVDDAPVRAARGRLLAAAESRRVRVHTLHATEGPDVGRFASLQAVGRYAAAYLAVALGRTGAET